MIVVYEQQICEGRNRWLDRNGSGCPVALFTFWRGARLEEEERLGYRHRLAESLHYILTCYAYY